MTTSSTSKQHVPAAIRPGSGPWVGIAPDGSVIPAPYLRGASDFSPAAGDSPDATGGFPGPAGDVPGPAGAALRRRRAGIAVFGAATVTGVLAVVAPFLNVWRYGFADGSFAAQTVVNGWGSVSAQPASFATRHSHDTNYGLPMVLAAAFLLVGAAAYAITRRAVVAALPIAVGASLAAGTALLLALDRGGRDSATSGTDSWGVGPGFWLIVAAAALGVVVALAVVALAALDLRAASARVQLPAAPGPSPDLTDRAWIAPAEQAWIAPIDPARFTPPWAP